MSHRRKIHDGDNIGRSIDTSKRRNTFNNKNEVDKHVISNGTKRTLRKLDKRSSDHDSHVDKDRYLLTYADLITLLLGLFIILYAMSNIDSEKYKKLQTAFGSVFGVQSELIELPKDGFIITDENVFPVNKSRDVLNRFIEENNYGNSVQLIDNERGITIRLLEEILFRSGSADLVVNSETVLSEISNVIKELPNDIRIEGHTDNIPINTNQFESNWHLSVERATNTAYYLMKEKGIKQEKVSIVGYAANKPIAPNQNEEGRALNRRVDIVILNNKKN